MAVAGTRKDVVTTVLVASAIVLFGASATTVAVRDAAASAGEADDRATELVANRLEDLLLTTLSSVRGIEGLVVDGTVTDGEFQAFAGGVIDGSLFQALAWAEVVSADDRAEFERESGLTIRGTDGAGGFFPALPADRYLVVRWIHPLLDDNRGVLGFDLASEPVRAKAAEQAEQRGEPVLSSRLATATGALVGVSLMHAARAPDGTVVGFVSSGLTVSDVIERVAFDEPVGQIYLTMDGEVLFGSSNAGATRSFEAGGRTFSVSVDSSGVTRLAAPILLAVGTVVVAAVAAWGVWRDRRQRRRLLRNAARNRSVAAFGQELAATIHAEEVVEVVLRRSADIVGAAGVVLLRPVIGSKEPAVDVAGNAAVVASLVRSLRGRSDVGDEVVSGRHVMTAPIGFSVGPAVGLIGFEWDEQDVPAPVGETRVAVTTLAELTARALERALTLEVVAARANDLGLLTRELAMARHTDDISAVVGRLAPIVLGAASADVIVGDCDSDEPANAVTLELVARGSDRRALRVVWRQGAAPSVPQRALVASIADVVRLTIERTMLVEQEHQIIVELQRQLLPAPIAPNGLDIAVGYRPAMTVVGLGGDFYNLVESATGHVYVNIGDVSGHGTEAVAMMAEMKGVVEHLLQDDVDLWVVCQRLDELLLRRDNLATAQLVEIDVDRSRLRVMTAGHLPALLRRAGGTVELVTGVHRTLLGLVPNGPAPTQSYDVSLDIGDVLVLYTDGLVEDRRHIIDDGIERLATTLRDLDGTADSVLKRLLEGGGHESTDEWIDDDVAVIVVRRTC